MDSKHSVKLDPIHETLLLPLWGRASETRKKNRILEDPKSLQIVESLDYDFSKWEGHSTLINASIRTRIFDNIVDQFLKQHPMGTVVEIGAGLNTRYERLYNGRTQWLELDLPDSMSLRQQFFRNNANRTMMAADILNTDWYESVLQRPSPYCFVAESVFMHLDNKDVKTAISSIAERFPDAWLIMDTISSKMVEQQSIHEIIQNVPSQSVFRWCCENPREIQAWGLNLLESYTLLDAPKDVYAQFPFWMRILLKIFPRLILRKVNGYRVNHFQLSPLTT